MDVSIREEQETHSPVMENRFIAEDDEDDDIMILEEVMVGLHSSALFFQESHS